MNKKLIALFVAIATVTSVSAYREQQYHTIGDVDGNTYYNNNDRSDYRYRDNRNYRPVRDTAGNIVEGTGNAVEKTAEVPGDVVRGIFGPRN
ncbi:MAG TPA: hypothetical protein VKU36_02070 [Candidatus Babeliales bacterium]|nr:hypothetical protein [Candidatus Babeliales bacterium]